MYPSGHSPYVSLKHFQWFLQVIWRDYELQLPMSSSKGTRKEMFHGIFTAGVMQKTQLRMGMVLNLGTEQGRAESVLRRAQINNPQKSPKQRSVQ